MAFVLPIFAADELGQEVVVIDELPSCLKSADTIKEIDYLCSLTCNLTYMYQHKTQLPPGYICEVRSKEYGIFQAWSDCIGNGLTLSYTSYEWNQGECVKNATGYPMVVDQIMGNEDVCEMVIKVTSNAEATDCMNFYAFSTREAMKKL
jgi:hypothetical protein